ncbi:hypothetical protein QBC34DRAFT_157315 [Podospora aff. communis PSN243]|uniref:Uncharacterized protein n=1 Tax=Podospora aff. communis PSN243 TaxID=3040156 RepID=A0AAV9H0U9_9PEZI|nr:hypothetical protein QBC34DRAFT_157315 [Podospora aff. communis PSN243]
MLCDTYQFLARGRCELRAERSACSFLPSPHDRREPRCTPPEQAAKRKTQHRNSPWPKPHQDRAINSDAASTIPSALSGQTPAIRGRPKLGSQYTEWPPSPSPPSTCRNPNIAISASSLGYLKIGYGCSAEVLLHAWPVAIYYYGGGPCRRSQTDAGDAANAGDAGETLSRDSCQSPDGELPAAMLSSAKDGSRPHDFALRRHSRGPSLQRDGVERHLRVRMQVHRPSVSSAICPIASLQQGIGREQRKKAGEGRLLPTPKSSPSGEVSERSGETSS